jgi:hypothetical protein
MATKAFTRRTVLQTAIATSAFGPSVLTAPFVHGAHAAGKLSLGFWDHWVPGANDAMTAICNEWAAKEKVDLTIDFITSQPRQASHASRPYDCRQTGSRCA